MQNTFHLGKFTLQVGLNAERLDKDPQPFASFAKMMRRIAHPTPKQLKLEKYCKEEE